MTGVVAAGGYFEQPGVGTVSISDQDLASGGYGTVTCDYALNNTQTVTSDGSILQNWLTGTGSLVANYEAMATKESGSAVAGTLATWLPLSTSRSWSVTNSAANGSTKSARLTVQIRLVSTGAVQDTATIILRAESISGDSA